MNQIIASYFHKDKKYHMIAVAYLRVSTQEQSLERQYEEIKTFAKEKNLKIIEFFEDKISGSKFNANDRIGFSEMDTFIKANEKVKHILTLEISRLGRRNNEIQNVIENYASKGINIHFKDLNLSTLDENGNRSFAADMVISLMGTMAANESRLLSDRIKSGKMSRAKKNLAFGGKIIGYKKGIDGTPVIDKNESPMIERIFKLTSEGMGMRNVSTIIESEFGKVFAIGTLGGIIRNTFHKGQRKYNELELSVPAIVSDELWQKANDFIDSRKKFVSGTKVYTNIVSGKITCGICNNRMHQKVIKSGRLDIFVCKDGKICKNTINRPWLFRMIRLAVERHALDTKESNVRKKIELNIVSKNASIDNNKKTILKLINRKKRVTKLYLDEDFTKDEFDDIKVEIEQERMNLEEANTTLKKDITAHSNALESKIEHFSKDLEIFKIEIQNIIKYIIVNKDDVEIGLYGWGTYELPKPNSSKLGWQTRMLKKGLEIKDELPARHPISDEDLEYHVNNELYFDEESIE